MTSGRAISHFGICGVVVLATCLLMAAGCGHDGSGDTVSMTPVYLIEGKAFELEEGVFDGGDGTISLLASTTGDLNGDTADDQAAILVHNSRGSGVFYYLNVFLSDGDGGLNAAQETFLGDRIRFDFMEIYGAGSVSRVTDIAIHPDDYGQLVIGFYAHGSDQAYAEKPEIYITRHLKIDDGNLVSMQ